MLGLQLLSASLFALLPLYANAQIETVPSNIFTGFVRLPQPALRSSAFAAPVKQLSFFYAPAGLVAYDGDVIFGTVEEFDAALVNVTYNSLSNTAPPSKRAAEGRHPHYRAPGAIESRHPPYPAPVGIDERSNSIFPDSDGIWPDSKISYQYYDNETESELSQYVQPAIDAWIDAVPCLRFEKLPNSKVAAAGVVEIVASDESGAGCFASVGYNASSPRWMSLRTGGACDVAVTIHEWGHILGLVHEQKRPDASKFNRFVCENLIDYPFGRSEGDADAQCCGKAPDYLCCGRACQFTPDFDDYNEQDPVPENGGAFDFDSIMLYRNNAFAKPETFTLLDGPNNFTNPQNLSSADTNRITQLYCADTKSTTDCRRACDPKPGFNKTECSDLCLSI